MPRHRAGARDDLVKDMANRVQGSKKGAAFELLSPAAKVTSCLGEVSIQGQFMIVQICGDKSNKGELSIWRDFPFTFQQKQTLT